MIGYLVAPILFASLEERRLAGELAGHMFTAMNYLGLVCGGVLLVLAYLRVRQTWFKDLRMIAIAFMLILILISAFVLQPMMQELKLAGLTEGSETAAQFGRLHGVSSLLYLLNSLLGLFLAIYRRSVA